MSGKARRRRSAAAAPSLDHKSARDKTRASLTPLATLKPYLFKYPGMIAASVAALVAAALATLAIPLAVRRVIDVGFGAGDAGLINRYFAALALLGVLLALASALRFYCVNWLGERVVADISAGVFRHLAALGPAFFETTQSGELMSRLTADTTLIKSAAGTALSQGLRSFIMLVGALILVVVTSARLSALVLIIIPVIVLPLVALGRLVRQRTRRAQDELAAASAYAAENLAASRTMTAYAYEDTAAARFRAAVDEAFRAAKKRLLARALLTVLAIGLVAVSIVGILWIGAAAVVGGSLTGGRLAQFVFYAVLIAGALAELSEVWGELNQAAGAAGRLGEILAFVPVVRAPAHPAPLPEPPRGEIVFRDVRFTYPSRPHTVVLDGLTFRVAPGETVALVGPSGAGKSTIFNLLLRFWDADSGTIEFDGLPVEAADPAEVRARLAFVPQDVALFAGTVADNIRYGRPSASFDDMCRAAAAAEADAFIRQLPSGYDTEIGERGVALSGGQRQRIAIARAVLKNAPVLLLDEATSALDAESERLTQRALDSVRQGRTTLVIAHRLATVLGADRILVIDGGRLADQGTHSELVSRGGLYQRLAVLQFADEAA